MKQDQFEEVECILQIFHTDTHYSAFATQNQPLFQKNLRFLLRFSRGKFFTGWVVKGVIFAQKIGHGNFHHLRKSKEFVTVCNNHVMSIPKGCGQPGKLWKTTV